MAISFLCCLFAQLLNKVSLQAVSVAEGVTGGSVVLPCVSREIDHKLSDIDVRWRHNGSLVVFDIIKGKDSVEHQDPGYKNRSETFPTEYEKGNFSLKLNNLTHADAGNYQCYIIHSFKEVAIQLIINEATFHTGKQPTPETENQAQETQSRMRLTPILSVFMLLCTVLYIGFKWKKPCNAQTML